MTPQQEQDQFDREAILRALGGFRGRATAQQLVSATGLSAQRAARALISLHEDRWVMWNPVIEGGRWVLTPHRRRDLLRGRG